jgi:long-subunit acyl-CoA synthetase (AMP-forming)
VSDDQGVVSAADLRRLVAEEARWLAAEGSQRFALLAANGRGWAITDLALLHAGLVNVPLPHHFGADQTRHALDSAGVGAILTDTPDRITTLDLGFIEGPVSPRTQLVLLTRPGRDEPLPALPAGTIKITYTSGSTAEPKGVCLTRQTLDAVAGSVAAIARQVGIHKHAGLLPLSTLLENVAGMYAAWLGGVTCDLASEVPAAIARGSLSPRLLLAFLQRHQPESVILVPELLRILVTGAEAGWQPPQAAKFFAVGGACVSRELLERAAAVRLPVFEGYGLSECGSVQCLNTPLVERAGSVGRALPHARVRIDARGEIHIGGAIMGGYVGQAALAPDAEIATGDLGEIDADGFVYVSGRIKNLFINSYGRNISPEWVERELTQEPAIGHAVAWGEARPYVVALVTPSHPTVNRGALDAAVADANARLPDYARVIRFAVAAEPFTVANGLLTGNGRPRRERILERHAQAINDLYWQARAS